MTSNGKAVFKQVCYKLFKGSQKWPDRLEILIWDGENLLYSLKSICVNHQYTPLTPLPNSAHTPLWQPLVRKGDLEKMPS